MTYRGNAGKVKRLVEEVEQMDRLDAHLIARQWVSGLGIDAERGPNSRLS